MSVSISSVSSLALVSTRSYICSMYTGETSIRMLTSELNTAMAMKPPRYLLSAARSGVAGRSASLVLACSFTSFQAAQMSPR